jgi:hypothetical protein
VAKIVTPNFSGDEAFFDALFEGAAISFADLRAKSERGEVIEPMSLPAKVAITIDNQYEVLSEQITHNVVGVVEGADPL